MSQDEKAEKQNPLPYISKHVSVSMLSVKCLLHNIKDFKTGGKAATRELEEPPH